MAKLLQALVLASMLTACIGQPEHRDTAAHAVLRSWMPVISVNDSAPNDPYLINLLPGDYRLAVLYRSYRYDYLCTCQISAIAGRSYEIVDHANPEPLVLYRRVRANGLWVERLDPVLPSCEQSPAGTHPVPG